MGKSQTSKKTLTKHNKGLKVNDPLDEEEEDQIEIESRSNDEKLPNEDMSLSPNDSIDVFQLDESESSSDPSGAFRKKLSNLTNEELIKLRRARLRKGVVLLSSLPPYIKVPQVRSLLVQFGHIDRIYLEPESDVVRKKRIRQGKSNRVKFTRGWVEFYDKRRAKNFVSEYNGQPLTDQRKSRFIDDRWSLKYLPRFKWDDLTKQQRAKADVREQETRTQIRSSRRADDRYLSNVKIAKSKSKQQEREKAESTVDKP